MERSLVVSVGILAAVLFGIVGTAWGLLYVATDPVRGADHICSGRPAGAPHCSNFRITARTPNRVEFSYDQSDGSHCAGYEEVRRGPLGVPAGGGSVANCGSPGQAPQMPTAGPPSPTPFPDGNPSCVGLLGLAAPVATAAGFELRVTNTSAFPCDVSGAAKLLFLDANGRPLPITVQPAGDATPIVVLLPATSAVLDFDFGAQACATPARMTVVLGGGGGPPVDAPENVCGPVTAHAARPAP